MDKTPIYIDPTAVVDDGCTIGAGTHVWHFAHLMGGCSVGCHCNIGQNVFIGKDVRVGNGVKIQNNVSLYAGVECEDDVFIGPSAVFTNVVNPRSEVNRHDAYRVTHIKRGATVGANATVVCGHTIGSYALIGAGAVVTHDVKDYALVVGNPAEQIGWVSRHGERLFFDDTHTAVCPATGERYVLTHDVVTLVEKKNLTDEP